MTPGPSHPATGSWSPCTSPSGYFSPGDYLAAFNKMMTSSLPVGSLSFVCFGSLWSLVPVAGPGAQKDLLI